MSRLKTFTISYQKALEACGGESVLAVLDTLQDEGVVVSYEVMINIQVPYEKAISVENFFLLKDYGVSGKKRK